MPFRSAEGVASPMVNSMLGVFGLSGGELLLLWLALLIAYIVIRVRDNQRDR